MTSSNGNIIRVTGPLCVEFTGHWWIPRTKGQWRGALMFSLICAWINSWVNNRDADDLRRHRAHYDVFVMVVFFPYVICILETILQHFVILFIGTSGTLNIYILVCCLDWRHGKTIIHCFTTMTESTCIFQWRIFNMLIFVEVGARRKYFMHGWCNCIPQNTVGCNYLSMHEILPTGVPKFSFVEYKINSRLLLIMMIFKIVKFLRDLKELTILIVKPLCKHFIFVGHNP